MGGGIWIIFDIDGGTKTECFGAFGGLARLAGMFAGEFGKYEWGIFSGLLHDIGKYSLRFQRRLQKEMFR